MRDRLAHQFQRSSLPLFMPLDLSDAYRFEAFIDWIPWRTLTLSATVGFVVYAILYAFDLGAAREIIVFGWFALMAISMCLEIIHKRVYLTDTNLVRQYGILGRKHRAVPLGQIREVTFSYPRFGESRNIGDVHVSLENNEIVLRSLIDPSGCAQRILDTRNKLNERRVSLDSVGIRE